MRLWSLHPRHLDPKGLVALWREGLLARAVLRGDTRGYRQHPQLQRFQATRDPQAAIDAYLAAVLAEADARGYAFDRRKIATVATPERIACSDGQLACEWQHLGRKLQVRSPAWHQRWLAAGRPDPHPLLVICAGPVEPWERLVDAP
jgi:hypothetical protein